MSRDLITGRIASQLKRSRRQRGWSLDKTAQATGVSKAMLGQIERQESSPTIATLWKIATGLQCSFSSFIDEPYTDNPGVEGNDAEFERDPNMKVKTLFGYSPRTGFETFEITLLNRHEQLSTPHQTGVLEHLHVLEGCLSVKQGNQWVTLNAGEQWILQADMPHGYRDEEGRTCFIDIIHYPPASEPLPVG